MLLMKNKALNYHPNQLYRSCGSLKLIVYAGARFPLKRVFERFRSSGKEVQELENKSGGHFDLHLAYNCLAWVTSLAWGLNEAVKQKTGSN